MMSHHRRTAGLLVAVFAWLGCGATTVSLTTLLHDARDNQQTASQKYEGKKIRTTGTIIDLGFKRFKSEGSDTRPSPVGSDAAPDAEAYPYVILAPDDPKVGSMVCWFGRDDRPTVEKLSKGTSVTVVGQFQEYDQDQSGLMAAFGDCSFE